MCTRRKLWPTLINYLRGFTWPVQRCFHISRRLSLVPIWPWNVPLRWEVCFNIQDENGQHSVSKSKQKLPPLFSLAIVSVGCKWAASASRVAKRHHYRLRWLLPMYGNQTSTGSGTGTNLLSLLSTLSTTTNTTTGSRLASPREWISQHLDRETFLHYRLPNVWPNRFRSLLSLRLWANGNGKPLPEK